MKPNIFIFHGTEGYPEENWFPWLKGKLEEQGYQVFVPQFPTPENQSVESWLKVLESYKDDINGDAILIGHSIGAMLILQLLQHPARKIKSAFLVAPAIGYGFGSFDFGWQEIKNNCKEFVVYGSDNDPYISLDKEKELAKSLGVELTFIPNAGHFNAKAGYLKFEDLLEKLESVLSK